MYRQVICAFLLGLLAGCGGGGSVSGNTAPVAEAGPSLFAELNQTVYLDGSGSSDVDGDAITYMWHVVQVPSSSTVNDSHISGPTNALAHFQPDVEGTYRLSLTVSDGMDAGIDSVTVVYVTSGTLNDTGQVRFSDGTAFSSIEPTTHPGQDGSFGRDVDSAMEKIGTGAKGFDFTKIDTAGNDLPKEAASWSCVRDNVTGMTWEVKTNSGGIHDKDTVYTHAQALTLATSFNSGVGFCGNNDWRLPSREELHSLVDFGIAYPGPTIDTVYFPNTYSFWYWTKDANAAAAGFSWAVNFAYGFGTVYSDNSTYRVRLVRGGPSTLTVHYTDNGDGTITDHATGLIWKKCSEGQIWDSGSNICTGDFANYGWHRALQLAQDVNDGSGDPLGFSDWRLPNKKELDSLADLSRTFPSIDPTVFTVKPNSWYWSSTHDASAAGKIWVVHFDYGVEDSYGSNNNYPVRLVRDGQW